MSVELLNPDGIFKPDSFFQVGIGTGSKVIFLSGQVAHDSSGSLVGKDDLAAQTEQVYINVDSGLKGAGAAFNDVVKLRHRQEITFTS